MNQHIITIKLQNELDVVLAYNRAMQLSQFTGLPVAGQTKFATAVSEICRNVMEHVGEGTIRFSVLENRGVLFLEAYITDRGRGIPNLTEILERRFTPIGSKGHGIYSSRKLVDAFQVESDFERGTRVRLQKQIPTNHPPINPAILKGWSDYFNLEPEISPYAEIKRQNMQLIEVMEQLRVRTIEAEYQLQQIQHLNEELQASNHEINGLLQERDRKNLQLERVNKTLDEFAHTITHDLKAPLQNLIGLTEAMSDFLAEDAKDEAEAVLPMVQLQITRMDHLIRDVLEYSPTGMQEIPLRQINIRELVDSVLSGLAVPAGFTVEVAEDLPVIEGEEIYLRQIFGNLVSNAIKYHDKETGHLSITAKEQANRWEFIVADDGPGILAEDHEKIFNMFETTSDVNHPGSTGIGLAIVKKIIQEKEGAVWVESEGRGTAMHFTWPLKKED